MDEDCDGLEDIEDGFSLSGQAALLGNPLTFDQAAAWSSELGAFGVYYFAPDGQIEGQLGPFTQFFFTISDDGAIAPARQIGVVSTSVSALAAGHGGFGHLYVENGALRFQKRLANGANDGASCAVAQVAASNVALAAVSTGWIASWLTSTNPAIQASRLQISGCPSTPTPTLVGSAVGFTGGPSVEVRANEAVIVFGDNAGVRLRRYTHELIPIANAQSIALGDDPAISATSSGFAVAWSQLVAGSRRVFFGELNAQGIVTCGPIEITTEATIATAPFMTAVRSYASGSLVAYVDDQDLVRRATLARVHTGCDRREVRHVLDDTSTGTKGHFSLVGATNRFLATWREPNLNRASFRHFGANLCD